MDMITINKSTVIVVVVAICVLIALYELFSLVAKSQKTKKQTVTHKEEEHKKSDNVITIERLLEIAQDSYSSKKLLSNVVLKVITSYPFPQRKSGTLSDEQNLYLSFVRAIASNKNADAKLIAYMSTELKKRNPAYSDEIEYNEKAGISDRGSLI